MSEPPSLVLFDGPCNLCNATVRFIIDRDRAGRFLFASLQSATGRRLLEEHGLSGRDAESVVLIDRGRAWIESDAALRVAGALDGPWRLLRALRVIPRPVRDAVYRWVARNRYMWFGRDACRLPTPELAARMMLDPPEEAAS